MKRIFLFMCAFFFGTKLLLAQQDSLLEKSITETALQEVLVNDCSWVAYPSYRDRQAWERLIMPELRKKIVENGEKALRYEWKPDLATDYLAYKRDGRILTGRDNQMNLLTLMLAELVEGKGRFIDQIVNGVWFLSEVSWVHSAHAYFQKDQSGLPDPDEPTVELVVSDIGAQFAWAYYFFHDEFDKISPLISKRIYKTVYERLITPYYVRSDYWWMGFQGQMVNNWNVWINYNVLQAVLILENNPIMRAKYVYKLMRSVDRYIDWQYVDGTCEEGPGYYGASAINLLKFLEILNRATVGRVNIFNDIKIKNLGNFIQRVHVDGLYFVNFSDCGPKVNLNPAPVYQYGKLTGDKSLMGFASDFAKQSKWIDRIGTGSFFGHVLDDVLIAKEVLSDSNSGFKELSYYFKEGELAIGRDSYHSDRGFCFAAHGSHNDVPHNHNDVGSFMLYHNGIPILIDAGVEAYTRKTFSAERYTIWTMQSCYHNVPTINGVDQKNGRKFHAKNVVFEDSGTSVRFSVDIAKAYPAEADVRFWERTYLLNRASEFVIEDCWKIGKTKGNTILNFMTVCDVEVVGDKIFLNSKKGKLQLQFDSKSMRAEVETVVLKAGGMKAVWERNELFRIRLTVVDPQKFRSSRIVITEV